MSRANVRKTSVPISLSGRWATAPRNNHACERVCANKCVCVWPSHGMYVHRHITHIHREGVQYQKAECARSGRQRTHSHNGHTFPIFQPRCHCELRPPQAMALGASRRAAIDRTPLRLTSWLSCVNHGSCVPWYARRPPTPFEIRRGAMKCHQDCKSPTAQR